MRVVFTMNKQGLFGAVEQYWTINEKPRLNRRNTYFEDTKLSSWNTLRVGIVAIMIALAIIVFWCVLGVIL